MVLILVIYLQVETLRKIAAILSRKETEYGEVQQRLNSVFNERVTKELGECRRVYATFSIIVILTLALTPSVTYSVQTMYVINTEVEIDKIGNIQPLPDKHPTKRIHSMPANRNMVDLSLLIVLVTLIIGVLTWWSLLQQLRPSNDFGTRDSEDSS